MTPEQQTLRDVIAEIQNLPADDQLKVAEVAKAFRQAIVNNGPLVAIALALVGAEIAAYEP